MRMFDTTKKRCDKCGLRFSQQAKFDGHLDWHYSVSLKDNQIAMVCTDPSA